MLNQAKKASRHGGKQQAGGSTCVAVAAAHDAVLVKCAVVQETKPE